MVLTMDYVHFYVLGAEFIAKDQVMFVELFFSNMGPWVTDLGPGISSKSFERIEEGKNKNLRTQ